MRQEPSHELIKVGVAINLGGIHFTEIFPSLMVTRSVTIPPLSLLLGIPHSGLAPLQAPREIDRRQIDR